MTSKLLTNTSRTICSTKPSTSQLLNDEYHNQYCYPNNNTNDNNDCNEYSQCLPKNKCEIESMPAAWPRTLSLTQTLTQTSPKRPLPGLPNKVINAIGRHSFLMIIRGTFIVILAILLLLIAVSGFFMLIISANNDFSLLIIGDASSSTTTIALNPSSSISSLSSSSSSSSKTILHNNVNVAVENDHYYHSRGSQAKSTINVTKSTDNKTLSLTSLTSKYYSLTICQLTLIIIEVMLALSIIFIIELGYDSMKPLACINDDNNNDDDANDVSVVNTLIPDAQDCHLPADNYNRNSNQPKRTNEIICMKYFQNRILIENNNDDDNDDNEPNRHSLIKKKRKYLILTLKIILFIIILMSILIRLLTLTINELNNANINNYYSVIINAAISANTTNGLLYLATTFFETILFILILTISNSNSNFDYPFYNG